MEITNNKINQTGTSWAFYGISIRSSGYSGPPYGTILRTVCSNIINRSYTGILLQSSSTLYVNKNSISFPSTSSGTRIGIQANSSSVKIRDNTIIKAGSSPVAANVTNLIGIYAKLSPGINIVGNTLTSMGSGIKMEGDCSNSMIQKNTMSFCWNGVRLTNAKIGTQGTISGSISKEWDNHWNNIPFGGLGIAGSISASTRWYALSPPNFNVTGFPFSMPAPTAGVATLNWINDCGTFNIINNIYSGGGGLANLPSPLNVEDRFNYFDVIVKGTEEYSDYPDEYSYYDKQYLYRSITDDPTLLDMGDADDTYYQEFKSECDLSNIGALDLVWSLVTNGEYETATDKLAGITPENKIEENLFTTYGIYLQYIPKEYFTYTEEDRSILEDIAFQDAITGGEGVFLARTLLDLDPDMKEGASERIAQHQHGDSQDIKTDFKIGRIYPNPSGSDLYLDYSIEQREKASLIVYDVLGRESFKSILNDEKSTLIIPSSSLGNGLFIYMVEVDGKEIVRDRFVKFTNKN